MRARRSLALVIAGSLLAAGAACSKEDEAADVRAAAQKFLDAWSSGNFDAAGAATDSPDGPRQWLPTVTEQLRGAKVRFTLGRASVGANDQEDEASQPFTASWAIPGQDQRWSYPNKLAMVKRDDKWTVHWEVTAVHPELAASLRFAVERVLPERAAILDRTGQPLFTKVPVTVVGLEPRKAGDLAATAAAIAKALAPVEALTAESIVADAQKAKPDAFVPVLSVRTAEYAKVASVAELPGVTIRSEERVLTESRSFGQPMLGRVGPITAEIVKESGAAFADTDVVGTSGLQRTFNKQLAGSPETKVSLLDSAAKPLKQLVTFPGRPGDPLKTTIDRAVQSAADKALAEVSQQAAIVAIQPSTGQILAVANSASANFNVALEGKYPPGSTFKIVTTAAALQAGTLRADGTVPCPADLVAGDKRFGNADKSLNGDLPLRSAFAKSCNTSFISLAGKLPDPALAETAAQFGIGAAWTLPVTTFSGSVPAPKTPAGKAADAIGQGTVLASPFGMAMVAATVKHGSVPAPSLILDQPATRREASKPLAPGVIDPLREFMRAVVTAGTAQSALGRVPGDVAGKTGTAEYGDATPPRAHSWFAGYRGDLSFAVFVNDGASTGLPAMKVANSFLTGLPAV